MSATHRRNKANIDTFWLRPVKSIVILSSAPLGATCKRKALRKATEHGHPNQARALRVYADRRSSASADEGARAPHAENLRSQARRSPWQRAQPAPLLGMAASFVVTHHHPSNSTCIALPRTTGIRRIGGRDNHWSIKSVGRTRPQNILLMEPVSNPSCLVWQLGRGRPPGLSLVNQNNPYLTEREVRAT